MAANVLKSSDSVDSGNLSSSAEKVKVLHSEIILDFFSKLSQYFLNNCFASANILHPHILSEYSGKASPIKMTGSAPSFSTRVTRHIRAMVSNTAKEPCKDSYQPPANFWILYMPSSYHLLPGCGQSFRRPPPLGSSPGSTALVHLYGGRQVRHFRYLSCPGPDRVLNPVLSTVGEDCHRFDWGCHRRNVQNDLGIDLGPGIQG